MLRNHVTYKPSAGLWRQQFSKSENSLEIEKTNFTWDQKRKHLILILETNQMISREIKALMKGNILILEAPLLSSLNKPLKSHHLGQETRKEFEEGFTDIGFSEIKLKYGYQYHLISCQAIDSKMIKVILGFSLLGRNGNKYE